MGMISNRSTRLGAAFSLWLLRPHSRVSGNLLARIWIPAGAGMTKNKPRRGACSVLVLLLMMPLVAAAEPIFPQTSGDFEDALSLDLPILETKSFNITKGYECVTQDPPRAAILFDYDSADLKIDFHPVLEALAEALQGRLADADFTLEGHTDSTGAEDYNMGLSLRRAQTVRHYLLGKGIEASRLDVTGKGELAPIADNATADGQAQNRRVEVVRVSGVCAD
jgi:hypothetical protein